VVNVKSDRLRGIVLMRQATDTGLLSLTSGSGGTEIQVGLIVLLSSCGLLVAVSLIEIVR